jgi:hypothetical protein
LSALTSYGPEYTFCEAEQTLFASFSGKRRLPGSIVSFNIRIWISFWGQARKPPGSASPSYGPEQKFCEAEQTLFCFFFWKRKNTAA